MAKKFPGNRCSAHVMGSLIYLGSWNFSIETCNLPQKDSFSCLPWVAVETTQSNFHSRFLIKLPICRNVGASRWGESPFTHPGIDSDPWRTDVNVARAKSLCGYILQGDGGITWGLRSTESIFYFFCLLLESGQTISCSLAILQPL